MTSNGVKSSLKKVKDCRVRLLVEVDAGRVEERYQNVLRDYQRKANLPGFREGKAPLDLVEKKFTKEVEEEVVKSLVPQAYHQCLAAEKVSAVTLPKLSEIHYHRGKHLTFTAEFDRKPEVSLKNYKGLRVKRASDEVSPGDVEKALSALVDSKADLVPLLEPRAIREGDFIIADIETKHGNDYVPARKGVVLCAQPNPNDDFFEKIVGADVDEIREISVDPTDEEKKGLVGRKPCYKVWIRGIRGKKVPALDDEFAKGFGRQTVLELRESVRRDLVTYKRGESRERMKEELFRKLLAQSSITAPEGLVEQQKHRLLEQAKKRAVQMSDSEAALRAAEQVQLYFILQAVADKEGIDVDEIELEARLQGLAEESKRPMEEVRRLFEEDLRDSLREARTVDFLLANAKLEDEK